MTIISLETIKKIPDYISTQYRLYRRYKDLFPISKPALVPQVKCIETEYRGRNKARINILLPNISPSQLSGGPNTAINLSFQLAEQGYPLRYISSFHNSSGSKEQLLRHMHFISGVTETDIQVEITSLPANNYKLQVDEQDIFIATTWRTAYVANEAIKLTRFKRFLYFIQDFEPAFFSWSSDYALALTTFDIPICGVVNSQLLADYLSKYSIGWFSDKAFRDACMVFDPPVDRTLFRPGNRTGSRKRLLFYARPNSKRNLFEIGLKALRMGVQSGYFDREKWEFFFIGSTLPRLQLGRSQYIEQLPWLGYKEYADLVGKSDIMLAPMLSPHTGYPALEMAAAGGIAVTTCFDVKNAERLQHLSRNIIAVSPDPNSLCDALGKATGVVQSRGGQCVCDLALPDTWDPIRQSFREWFINCINNNSTLSD